jgi:hypothetical protein
VPFISPSITALSPFVFSWRGKKIVLLEPEAVADGWFSPGCSEVTVADEQAVIAMNKARNSKHTVFVIMGFFSLMGLRNIYLENAITTVNTPDNRLEISMNLTFVDTDMDWILGLKEIS